MDGQPTPDAASLGDARRVDALVVSLLFAASVPPALGLVVPAFANPTSSFWHAATAFDWGMRTAGVLGAAMCSCAWFSVTWGYLVPPLLAALALGRLISVRRAVVLTAAYVVGMAVIRAAWLLWVWLALPWSARDVIFNALDILVRLVSPGVLPLLLVWYPGAGSRDRPWQAAVGVTRVVLVCSGALGLLFLGLVMFQFRSSPIMAFFYARNGQEAALHAVQLLCGLLFVRHGVVRCQWLWIGTAGAVIAWGVNLALELTLEPAQIRLGREIAEAWCFSRSLLGSLAAAAGVLVWFWWPDLLDRRQLADGRSCWKCGYDLTGNLSGRCPECGTPVEGGMR